MVKDLEQPRKELRHHSSRVSPSRLGNLTPTSVPGRYKVHGSNRSSCAEASPHLCGRNRQAHKIASPCYGVRLWHSSSGWCHTPGSECIISTPQKGYRWFLHQRWDLSIGRCHAHTEENSQSPRLSFRRDSHREKRSTVTNFSWVQECTRHRQKLRQ